MSVNWRDRITVRLAQDRAASDGFNWSRMSDQARADYIRLVTRSEKR